MSDSADNLPLVSIITVTRNLIEAGRKDFFKQAVASVKMQDYPNIEHLIIDGASTDGTVEMLQEMKLNFISEPDTGIQQAYNKGIRRANGKYIAFLNSDDFYTRKDAVSMVVDVLENSQADFTYASYSVVRNDNSLIYIHQPKWNCAFINMPFGHPTMFAKKQMLEDLNGFDENYHISSDFDLVLRALLIGKRPVQVDVNFVAFRLGGISNTQVAKTRQEDIKILAKNCNVSDKIAKRAKIYNFLPKDILLNLINKTIAFPDVEGLIKNNRKHFLKYLRRQLITLRLRKGKRCFRLLGITIYTEEKND